MNKENTAVLYGIVAAAIYGLFPVLIHHGSQTIPPTTLLGIATLLGAATAFLFLAAKKKVHQLFVRKAWFPMFMVTLLIVVIPWSLISYGASLTTGVNTSLLLLSEIIYTMIFTHFIGEPTTRAKVFGALGVLLGCGFIVYNGTTSVNMGDMLIFIAPIFFPLGNFFSKKAFHHVDPETITTFRYTVGGVFILAISRFVETAPPLTTIFSEHIALLLVLGIGVIGVRTLLAYESLRSLDISKFILIANTSPFWSLLILLLFFGERITAYQEIGFAIMMIGVYFAIKRKSVDPQQTAYRQQDLPLE